MTHFLAVSFRLAQVFVPFDYTPIVYFFDMSPPPEYAVYSCADSNHIYIWCTSMYAYIPVACVEEEHARMIP